MNEFDWNFYHDQCGPNTGKFCMNNEEYTQSDFKFISRMNRKNPEQK